MYRREDDRYESKRRSNSRNEHEDDCESSRKSRGRWDDRRSGTERNYEQSRSSRWDIGGGGSSSGSGRDSKDHAAGSRWDDRRTNDTDKWKSESRRDSSSRDRDRRKSRSRSRSPFRRSSREYLNYSNPVKDEKDSKPSDTYHSMSGGKNDGRTVVDTKRQSNWSDSSDEDNRSKSSNRTQESFRSAAGGGSGSNNFNYQYELQRQQTSSQSSTLWNNSLPSDVAINKQPSSDSPGEAGRNSCGGPGITLKLSGSSTTKPLPLPKVIGVSMPVKSTKVSAIFNSDDDDEPEEMPPECKMRMKNVGRETKTSEGPNSFGKTKIGFCNLSHLAEKQLEGKIGISGEKK